MLAGAIPARFVIDAAALRYSSDGPLTLAAASDGSDAGTSATLGQGCFGKVMSMSWNGSSVAVKELSGNALDKTSLGACGASLVVGVLACVSRCVCPLDGVCLLAGV